jgi:hypothetical protein
MKNRMLLRLATCAALALAAGCGGPAPAEDVAEEGIDSTDGKEDSRRATDKRCKQTADDTIEAHVKATWDFGFIQSTNIIRRTANGMVVKVVVIDGGFDDGDFEVQLDRACRVQSFKQTKTFTP